jgi:hypothetical protein
VYGETDKCKQNFLQESGTIISFGRGSRKDKVKVKRDNDGIEV